VNYESSIEQDHSLQFNINFFISEDIEILKILNNEFYKFLDLYRRFYIKKYNNMKILNAIKNYFSILR